MNSFPNTLKFSLIACSVPSALIALVATLAAWLQWGGLSFGTPVYYATLALAACCPVSKLVAWRFWRREVNLCPTCIPARAVRMRRPSTEKAGQSLALAAGQQE